MHRLVQSRKTILTALAASVTLMSLIVGCSDGDDDGKSSDGGSADSDSEIDDSSVEDGNEADADASDSGDIAPTVDLADGTIEGFVAGSTLGFLGIPFAAPPIGELRWRPPQPVEPWDGVRDAKEPRFACIQAGIGIAPVGETSEDCLHLNVWTPDLKPSDPLPVMVWLHGGANSTGSAVSLAEAGTDELSYTGQYFIEAAPRPIVVVTVNYRLNRFGFLAHPGLTAEEGASGNYGLMDQQAALRWVRDNISAFGGDPENVTLFGESAGGLDTCLQVMAPDSAGLIHRAILESAGQCYPDRWELDEAEASGADFAEFVGCTGSDDAKVIDCLRGLSEEDILKSAPSSGDPLPGGVLYQGPARWRFYPIVDGVFLPKQVDDIIASDEHAKIPMVIGTNDREGDLFHGPLLGGTPPANDTEYQEALERVLGDAADAVADAYPISDFDTPNDALSAVTGDSGIVCPGWNLARALVGQGDTVFKYNYTHELGFSSLSGMGPTHGTEVALVWGWASVQAIAEIVTEADRNVGETIVDYWTRFAYTGDPNGDAAAEWPQFNTDTESELVLDDPVSSASGRMTDKCDFWATIQ